MREDCNKHPNVKVKVEVAAAGKNFEFALDTFQKKGLHALSYTRKTV